MIGESDRDEREELEIEDDYPLPPNPAKEWANRLWGDNRSAEERSEDYFQQQ